MYTRCEDATSEPIDCTFGLGHAAGQAYRFGHPRSVDGSANALDPITPTASWCSAIDTNQYWFSGSLSAGTHAPRVQIEQMITIK